jgi:hypothetical protein
VQDIVEGDDFNQANPRRISKNLQKDSSRKKDVVASGTIRMHGIA